LPESGARRRVLLVEDTPEFVSLIVPLVEAENYEVTVAGTGAEAVEAARGTDPDVVLLDVVLPDTSGFEVCRELRTFSSAYVIMLTSRTDEIDRVVGLSVGADDYVTKPFSPRELVARIEAMMRRPRAASYGQHLAVAPGARAAPPPAAPTAAPGPAPPPAPAAPPPVAAPSAAYGESRPGSVPWAPGSTDVVELGDLSLCRTSREVTVEGREVDLTRIEYEILATLASNPRMVFTRELLREQVWGPNWYGDDHVVDVHVANLRKKLDAGRDSSFLRTVRGVGYRLSPS
jgi:DNA-binding response OmpR family regulator